VSANTRPGLQYVDPRVPDGDPDEFPDVDAEPAGDSRYFVGEGDVDVPEGVLGQLAEFGRGGASVRMRSPWTKRA
jgi:hypothetical protein